MTTNEATAGVSMLLVVESAATKLEETQRTKQMIRQRSGCRSNIQQREPSTKNRAQKVGYFLLTVRRKTENHMHRSLAQTTFMTFVTTRTSVTP